MDNRLGAITVLGKEYPLNYSVAASRKISALAPLGKEATVQDNYERAVKYLYILMEEGTRYTCYATGAADPVPYTEANLLSIFTPGDMEGVIAAVNQTIERGSTREVQVKPPKNGATAPPPEAPQAQA